MILVTAGTAQQPFNRLVKVMDDFAAQTDEKVIIQAGTTTYEPLHAEYFCWTSSREMEKYTQESRMVVSQASAGAIILALKFKKPVILVPRLSKYGENFNDHQYQLAFALHECGQAVLVENLTVAGIQEAFDLALRQGAIHSSRKELVNGLKNQLDSWQRQIQQKKSG